MRKWMPVVLVSLSLFLIVMSVVPVSAATNIGQALGDFIENVVNALRPLLEFLVGEIVPASASAKDIAANIFMSKLLLLVLVFVITWSVVKTIPTLNSNNTIIIIISVIVSMLSVRFLPENFIQTIMLPYTTYGVAITALLPFVIFFFLTQGFGKTGRRLAWILFAVAFLGLYIARIDELGEAAWIYPLAAVAALVMVVFDGTLHKFRENIQLDKAQTAAAGHHRIQLQKELNDVTANYAQHNANYVSAFDPSKKGRTGYLHDVKEIRDRLASLSTT
ncbi:hypothetical protein KW805_01485 [Candidatus Pacearchaeota archaeon]|nr:hypothetical protein [Candidatus Pacearchaeota archaeon]